MRTITINGQPWYVAKDVCKELGIKNPSDTVSRLGNNQKDKYPVETSKGLQKLLIISQESYDILSSKRKRGSFEDLRRELTKVRTEFVDGMPYWCSSDVLEILSKEFSDKA